MNETSVAPGQTAAILDLDGTLVDSNYHHALAWYRAFREADVVLPIWQLHRHVGIGGDKYVAAVAGDEVEQLLGDELRRSWERHFGELLPEIQPCDGARELMVELKARSHRVVVATSAIQTHFDTFIDNKLSARELADDWTTTDDVENSKPAPDLVTTALAKAGTSTAVMIGDTPWDCQAADRAGIQTICLLTGGFSEGELRAAGAAAVYKSPRSLADQLDETALA